MRDEGRSVPKEQDTADKWQSDQLDTVASVSHDRVRSYQMVLEPSFMLFQETSGQDEFSIHVPGFTAIQVQWIMRGVLK